MDRRRMVAVRLYMAVCVMAVCLWSCSKQAFADQTCRVQIELKEFQSKYSDRNQVPVWLYRMGTVDKHGKPVLDLEWGYTDYPQESAALDELARELAVLAEKEKLVPAYKGKTDRDGISSFDGLETGIYLIVVPKDNPYGIIAPFLVNLPYYEAVNGEMKGPMYEVRVQPKGEVVEKSSSVHLQKPTIPDEPDQPLGPPQIVRTEITPDAGQSVVPSAAGSVKTGDESCVEWFLLLMLSSVGSMMFLAADLYRENREWKEE